LLLSAFSKEISVISVAKNKSEDLILQIIDEIKFA
jgi:hypothetical protein